MANYLITGGAGFIGSHLCQRLLKKGNNIINIDNFSDFYSESLKIRNVLESIDSDIQNINTKEELMEFFKKNSNYKLEIVDIRNIDALDRIFFENKIDIIVHLAAMAGVRPSIENPLLYEDVNVKGSLNLLETARKYKVNKIIAASSSSVYGNNKKVPFAETDNVDFPISPYAATKKMMELLFYTYYNLYSLNSILLRFFTVYGPRQRPDLAISKFTNIISNSKEIPFYGDGSTKRDYTYVEDIIDGIEKAIAFLEFNNDVYEIFNLGNSSPVTLKKLVDIIENELGKEAIIKKQPLQPGDVEKTFADIIKAKKLLGYEPKITIEEGIKRYIEWFKKNKNF